MANGNNERTEAYAVFMAAGTEVAVVEAFLRTTVRPAIDAAQSEADEYAVLHGQFLRLLGWSRTLCKLAEPADFQAVVSGCRALFEISVDITLLCNDVRPVERLLAWEDAVKLKQARALVRYCQNLGVDPAEDHPGPAQYAQRQAPRIEARCQAQGWVNNGRLRVPARWTGNDLLADSRVADGFSVYEFEQFYETRYRELCWNTHGSAAAGIRTVGAAAFPGIPALGLRASADLAVVAARTVVDRLNLSTPELQEAFEAMRQERIVRAAAALANARTGEA